MEEVYDPSSYSDADLIDVFWVIDKDKYPSRYQSICSELDKRKIEYTHMTQWERNKKNLDEEVEVMGRALQMLAYLVNISRSLPSLIKNVFR